MDREEKLAEALIKEFETPKNALLGAIAYLKKQRAPRQEPAPAPVQQPIQQQEAPPQFKPKSDYQDRDQGRGRGYQKQNNNNYYGGGGGDRAEGRGRGRGQKFTH